MRTVAARGNGFALAEMLDGDRDALSGLGDGAYEPDRDDEPPRITLFRLAITSEDGADLLGMVSWHAVGYGPSVGSQAWDIGTTLLPTARDSGIGTAVAALLARYLFDTTSVHRIQAATDVVNTRAQRVLKKAGFTREGVLRGAQQRGGEHRDMVSYSLLRTDVTGEKLTASQNASAELASRDG